MSDDDVAAARPSPLHEEHLALGATLVPFAGWLMPLRYGSDLAEHTAVRTAAGLFDLSHMAELWWWGPTRARSWTVRWSARSVPWRWGARATR